LITVVGMSFTWPTLEALVSEEEPAGGLQHMVGIYNAVWAATAAVANFFGGAMLDKFGLRSLFFVAAAIQLVQLGLTCWLESQAKPVSGREKAAAKPALVTRETARTEHPPSALDLPAAAVQSGRPAAATFLRMAWVANPFAYIAINTLIAVVPGVAARLQLSTTLAGFCCSVWCFSRFGAFLLLWQWAGWHYRFRWLLVAYIALVATFASVVLAPNLAVLVAGQLVFGVAVGLLYYSSLFYSMDLGDSKGEHGGIHEAVIGLGNCAGPAVGAGALYFLPQYSSSGTFAVTLLLLSGLGGLLAIWNAGRQRIAPRPVPHRS
ncbi:MAG: MFS transporter, partial [Limisphaerales bacterium]